MLRAAKLATLAFLRRAGAFELVASSGWRRERLLILCYHGVSLEDEHLWRPALYISPEELEKRLSALRSGDYQVLALGPALDQLREGTLPPRSVVLTFDDGTYDFYKQAYPLLKRYAAPGTVYLTTYYNALERPVFNLICSYMLWKRRGQTFSGAPQLGLREPLDLTSEPQRHKVVRSLIEIAERENMTGIQKDSLAARLAEFLQIDYEELKQKRILQIMNAAEVQEVASGGIEIELHTHRHRMPEDPKLFGREIQDNRVRIRELTGREAVHFCYPGGIYKEQMLTWMRDEGVESATTCDVGLATRTSPSLLLPRFVDGHSRSQLDFESWLCGVGHLLAFNRAATQKYVPAND